MFRWTGIPWKSPVEHGRAWLRNTGSPAGFKPKAVPEACAAAKYKAIQSTKQFTRHTRHRRQSHRCLDEPEYRGKALWSTVGHGCETPDPQQDSSPRRCQKRAQRCSRNSIFGTATYKAIQSHLQGIQGIEGKAKDAWMNRSTVEKCCGARWGMVAKHRIPSRIQAQGGARSVRRDAREIASSEPLNTSQTMQNKAYKT